jgi:hypothetical protein
MNLDSSKIYLSSSIPILSSPEYTSYWQNIAGKQRAEESSSQQEKRGEHVWSEEGHKGLYPNFKCILTLGYVLYFIESKTI